MKDLILKAYLEEFIEKFNLANYEASEAFEHFANHCIVSHHYPDVFELEDVSVGGSGDLGLDGVAILVNEHLVTSTEAIDYFRTQLRRLDVEFIFIQAKKGPKFGAADIGNFLHGVREFFKDVLPPHANHQLHELHELKTHIYGSSYYMDSNPTCRLYYVSTGKWRDEPALTTRIEQGIDDLKDTELFSSVTFHPLDAERVKWLYRELNQKIVREFEFERHTILPGISGVQEAYIGIVPATEFIKLISSPDGSLNRHLFYDNVRDFQGRNPVNREIEATLQSEDASRFVLLNNGVTVVAGDLNKVGTRFKLIDYQIVNGCQTSHILHLNRDHLTPNVYLPIKLVVTKDDEVASQVTFATNRQTEVKLEAFESTQPFQKHLEEFYLAMRRTQNPPLLYERRSKQYEHLRGTGGRVITLAAQINAFLAMFLNEPHSTHRYYGELLSSYRHRLFQESHRPIPYYTSGLAISVLDRLFDANILPREWRPRRYQLLMVYRLQNEQMALPSLNSNAIEGYCKTLIEKLSNQEQVASDFRRAGELVETIRSRFQAHPGWPERTRVFTEGLIRAVKGTIHEGAQTDKESGVVKMFNDTRGFGFITVDDGPDVFVHYTKIPGSGYRTLTPGQQVLFVRKRTSRGYEAIDLELIG